MTMIMLFGKLSFFSRENGVWGKMEGLNSLVHYDSPLHSFNSLRGLRQGNHLSPLLSLNDGGLEADVA